MMPPVIQLSGICKSYAQGESRLQALKTLDLAIAPGEFLAITGPSGSGKSTLLNILGLLDRPDGGEYRLENEPVQALSETHAARIRNRKIGFVFQAFHLLPSKTAIENIALPLFYRGVSTAQANAQAEAVLTQLGLAAWANHRPAQLSGGQSQRVAIARALVADPAVLLADEPTGNLDSSNAKVVLELLEGINRRGKTIIVVTHDHAVASHARRCLHMVDGEVAADRREL